MLTISYDDHNVGNHVAEFKCITTDSAELILRVNNPIYLCALGERVEINKITYTIVEIVHFQSEFKIIYSMHQE
jgi:hypothetical protein